MGPEGNDSLVSPASHLGKTDYKTNSVSVNGLSEGHQWPIRGTCLLPTLSMFPGGGWPCRGAASSTRKKPRRAGPFHGRDGI
jgi:hypothetical protein